MDLWALCSSIRKALKPSSSAWRSSSLLCPLTCQLGKKTSLIHIKVIKWRVRKLIENESSAVIAAAESHMKVNLQLCSPSYLLEESLNFLKDTLIYCVRADCIWSNDPTSPRHCAAASPTLWWAALHRELTDSSNLTQWDRVATGRSLQPPPGFIKRTDLDSNETGSETHAQTVGQCFWAPGRGRGCVSSAVLCLLQRQRCSRGLT